MLSHIKSSRLRREGIRCIHLTEICGLLEKLLPCNLVLADRGFNIQESVGLFCAEVKIPPFTKGEKQLSKAVDNSRQLSCVCIHGRELLGSSDKSIYSILESTLPINFIMCAQEEDTSVIKL